MPKLNFKIPTPKHRTLMIANIIGFATMSVAAYVDYNHKLYALACTGSFLAGVFLILIYTTYLTKFYQNICDNYHQTYDDYSNVYEQYRNIINEYERELHGE